MPHGDAAPGSLEGIGGLKTSDAYHSKADAFEISEIFFFQSTGALFQIFEWIKSGTFSALHEYKSTLCLEGLMRSFLGK